MTQTSAQILDELRRYESRNVTFIAADGSWPIIWQRARGVRVWDSEGKKYLDLTAAFGVAAAGHANPRVVAAAHQQMRQLLHAMGDVHPHPLKARLARELSRMTFERWTGVERRGIHPTAPQRCCGKTIFCNSGFEAVEAALKTALMATGRPRIVAFQGAYHGLGYGALNATHRDLFRSPFRQQLKAFAEFAPFPLAPGDLPKLESALQRLSRRRPVGAVLVEPVQGRGGIRVPPPEFLPWLRQWCDQHGALLIVDEIYTGFGRTGRWFACEHSGTVPDLICLGKALTGGFPLSACVGRADLMDAAWPVSEGEAIHTSTFLGHPVGCAMALAQIQEISRHRLVARSERLGTWLLAELMRLNAGSQFRLEARGLGLMAGLEWRWRNGAPAPAIAMALITRLLHLGFILLPEGAHSNVLSFTPPLTIRQSELAEVLSALSRILPHD
jgi:4-aminobutyrate aminotransferase/(S)-3-amino-2-methylpropionate transaminase